MVIVGQHLGQEVDLQILRRGSVRHQPSLVPRPEDDAVFRKDLSGGDPTSGADDAAVAQLSRSTDVRLENGEETFIMWASYGGGVVVSVLAFYSDDPSSYPPGYLKFLYEKTKIKTKEEAGVGPSLKNKVT